LALAEYYGNPTDVCLQQLQDLEFNPFDWNDDNIFYDCDPDLHYYNEISHFNISATCNYHLEDSFNCEVQKLACEKNFFSIIHLNIRSIPKNLSTFDAYLNNINCKFTVIGISESWLTDENAGCYTLNGYQHVYTCRNEKRGGGVSMFIDENLTVNLRKDLDITDQVEAVFVELQKDECGLDHNVIIGTVYRPPNQCIDACIDALNEKISLIKNENKILYLIGDFNVNLLKHAEHIPTAEFLENMYSHSLLPLITKPTRLSGQSASLIDNIFTNNHMNSKTLNGILLANISDHLPIFTINCNSKIVEKENEVRKRVYSQHNIELFSSKLEQLNWNAVLNDSDGPSAFDSFYQTFSNVYNDSFPFKTFKPNYKNKKP
jgi:hypothetical protein